MSDSAYYLRHLVQDVPTLQPGQGASSYFSAPEDHLDPNLFDQDEKVHQKVRQMILQRLYKFWSGKLAAPRSWSTVWIAGSAASYQWSADRGNGDLDILIGIDWFDFFAENPRWSSLIDPQMGARSPASAADIINAHLHIGLWPKTAATKIGDRTYEITFYVNAQGTDIRDIHAYAAYDLTHNEWTIRPPQLPHDPTTLYDDADWQAAHADANAAGLIRDEFNTALTIVQASQPGTPGWINSTGQLVSAVRRAGALFDAIHLGRRDAFASTGIGYQDPANFRWQAAKKNGVTDELSKIKDFDYTDVRNPLANALAERAADTITRRRIQP